MNEAKAAYAPYNFVPFSSKMPIRRYKRPEELPAHNVIDPALYTGEIQVTVSAKTPIFISAGADIHGKQHFFTAGDGRYAIPGSSLRGLVRENMQVLGLGVIRRGGDLEDRNIFYRKITAQKKRSKYDKKIEVKDPLVEDYWATLNIELGPPTTPKEVKAGYLYQDASGYHIEPTPKGSSFRISRQEAAEHLGLTREIYAQNFQVAYEHTGKKLLNLQKADAPVKGLSFGTLLFTGKNTNRAPNPCYLFPECDGSEIVVDLSPKDVLSYRLDYKDRVNSLKAYYDPEFWALPEPGQRKPVFYAHIQGHTYWGMSLFPRIGYLHSLAEGLPQTQKDTNDEESFLDYVYSIMGFIGEEHSYRSRLSFEDLPLVSTAHTASPVTAILGGPKPSYYMGYVVDGYHYNREDFRLRGYKYYWMKDFKSLPEPEKKNVAATLYPLSEGAAFRGTIRFRNLHEDELGLLLWCLTLEQGCFQSMGMGKPLGLGRIEITVDGLKFFKPGTLYQDLTADGELVPLDLVEHYIHAYDRFACKAAHVNKPKGKPSLRSLSEIQDFLFIHHPENAPKDTDYMALEEYRFTNVPLPTVASFREYRESEKKIPNENGYSLFDLQAKFNTNQNRSTGTVKKEKGKW